VVAYPDVTGAPTVSLVALLGVLIGLLPAVATPEPAVAAA
jgi:energy-coupling factor transport system permease protein